jgi:bifunctional oligoribonuclease and PAP phosphatase NrnA
MENKVAIQALRSLLAQPGKMAIITHFNPDGDAMGSSLGLAHVLRAIGHHVTVVLPNTPPTFLHWMPGYADCLAHDRLPHACKQAILECDTLFALDFNRPGRVNALEATLLKAKHTVLIDHHRDPDGFAALTFSDTSACATCQMVFDILEQLGLQEHIGPDAATCLYSGIMTDSGSFRFGSTTPRTLEVAAALMHKGAVPERICSAILDSNTENRLRLLGFALHQRMQVMTEERTCVFALSKEDLEQYAFQPGDTEGLVNYGLSISNIRLAAFFMGAASEVKVSLRSKGQLPVDKFLHTHFSGGGHRNAAGGRFQGALADAIAHFHEMLPGFLAQYPA